MIDSEVLGVCLTGGLAQLAERVLSMHEVLGSIPKFSTHRCTILHHQIL